MESIKSLRTYHEECREIDTTSKFQVHGIETSRRDLLQKAKLTQEKRCLTSIRSGYCLRMTPQTIRESVKLPFIKPDGFSVLDNINHDLKNDVHSFIHSLYKCFPDLPSLFARVSSDALAENVPFLPNMVKPRDFLASSTLPALFGHCWSVELRKSYIDFLINIAKQLPQSVFQNIREHWLFECFKNYIHASNIHHFLKLSIGDAMLQLVRENTNKTPRLTSYANDMVMRMRSNISSFPNDVRLLLKKFADLAPDDTQRLSRIEILFIDCILAPAISLPKAYCILPPTFNLDMSATGPARTLQHLAQHFRLILHPEAAQLRNIAQNDIGYLQKIPLGDFLNQLVDVDENDELFEIGGPSLTEMMSLLNTDSTFLLFTMSDICLLAKILNSNLNLPSNLDVNNNSNLSSFFSTVDKIPINQPFSFDFFRIEFSNIGVLGFKPPILSVNEIEKVESTALSSAASGLYNFLSCAKEKSNPPEDLNEFLRIYEREARLKQDFITYTYLNHLIMKLSDLKESQHCDILFALDDEIKRHREYLMRNNNIITNIARMMQKLDIEINKYQEKAEQSYPIVYGCLLNLLLQFDQSITSNFQQLKSRMLVDKKCFMDFFSRSIQRIKDFVSPIADYATTGVAMHFHSWLMQSMPLRDFIDEHQQFVDGDMRLTVVKKDVIQQVCVIPAPTKLQNIFANPPLFDFVLIELRSSEFAEIPLEAMKYISSAINLIQRMFDLAIGGAPQADEMTPLFNYALLSSGFNAMLSFEKYLEHFLFELPQGDLKLMDEQTSVALTHFINHVASLDQIVATQIQS